MNSQFNHPTLNRKQKNKEMKQHIAHGFMHFLMFYVLRKLHWATICKTVRPMLSGRCPVCPSVCPLCNVGVNGWMDQDETWHGDRTQPRPHCVRWGAPLPGKGIAALPLFGLCLLWPKGHPSQLLLSTFLFCYTCTVSGQLTLMRFNK